MDSVIITTYKFYLWCVVFFWFRGNIYRSQKNRSSISHVHIKWTITAPWAI